MQQQFVRARKTKKMRLLGCMHGCKNVPSTTGKCEIKARAPFPHSAMLSAGRPHNGAKKKAPGKKTRFFLFNIALWGNGARAFISHIPV